MPDDPITTERNTRREAGPQPDPMLQEGRASSARKWGITAAIVVVLLFVMYGLTARHESEQSSNSPAIVGSNNTQPSQPIPGGRGTADAPNSPPVTTPK